MANTCNLSPKQLAEIITDLIMKKWQTSGCSIDEARKIVIASFNPDRFENAPEVYSLVDQLLAQSQQQEAGGEQFLLPNKNTSKEAFSISVFHRMETIREFARAASEQRLAAMGFH